MHEVLVASFISNQAQPLLKGKADMGVLAAAIRDNRHHGYARHLQAEHSLCLQQRPAGSTAAEVSCGALGAWPCRCTAWSVMQSAALPPPPSPRRLAACWACSVAPHPPARLHPLLQSPQPLRSVCAPVPLPDFVLSCRLT